MSRERSKMNQEVFFMRMVKFMVPFVLALIVCAGSQAAEKGDAHKLVGELSAKPADAKTGVVAVLATHGHKDKATGAMTEGKKYHLVADAAVATQIAEFLTKGGKVEVTGSGTEEAYTVTAIAESKKKPGK